MSFFLSFFLSKFLEGNVKASAVSELVQLLDLLATSLISAG